MGSAQHTISTILSSHKNTLPKNFCNNLKFDIVSAQFNIHYMFENESKLNAFFQNVTDRLAPGGVFIATTIDSDRLVYKIRESGPKLSISNKFFSVVFKQDSFPKKENPYGL